MRAGSPSGTASPAALSSPGVELCLSSWLHAGDTVRERLALAALACDRAQDEQRLRAAGQGPGKRARAVKVGAHHEARAAAGYVVRVEVVGGHVVAHEAVAHHEAS